MGKQNTAPRAHARIPRPGANSLFIRRSDLLARLIERKASGGKSTHLDSETKAEKSPAIMTAPEMLNSSARIIKGLGKESQYLGRRSFIMKFDSHGCPWTGRRVKQEPNSNAILFLVFLTREEFASASLGEQSPAH